MVTKNLEIVVMVTYATCMLFCFEVAAVNYGDINNFQVEVVKDGESSGEIVDMDRRELGVFGEVGKGFRHGYTIWNRRKKTFERVNWTISEVYHYLDKQCSPQNYCCLKNRFLQCKRCCNGLRPDSSPSPSPSPLQSPVSPSSSPLRPSPVVSSSSSPLQSPVSTSSSSSSPLQSPVSTSSPSSSPASPVLPFPSLLLFLKLLFIYLVN